MGKRTWLRDGYSTMREKKMKKILSVSIVAMLAVSPMMANAAALDPQPTYNPTAGSGNATTIAAPYASKTITTEDQQGVASAAYVKGAYNEAIRAVNKVAVDAGSAAGDAAAAAEAAQSAAEGAQSAADAAQSAAEGAQSAAEGAQSTADAAASAAAAAQSSANAAQSAAEGAQSTADAAASAAAAAQSTADAAASAAAAAQSTANGRATHEGVEDTIDALEYTTAVTTPIFVAWGDPTATASTSVVTATTSASAASYVENQ